ncbi:MAG: hypothetical protein GY714_20235 [Desulfobacterales bacterium]|nr:hypothetical protein [Desulfobacterales bacterium]
MTLPALNTKGIDITEGLDRMDRRKESRERQVTRDKQNALLDIKLSPEAIKTDRAIKNAILKEQELQNTLNGAKAIRNVMGVGYSTIYDDTGKALSEFQERLKSGDYADHAEMLLPNLDRYKQKDVSSPTGYRITKENQEKLRRIYEGFMTEAGKVGNRGTAEYKAWIDGDGNRKFIAVSTRDLKHGDVLDLQKLTGDPGARWAGVESNDKTLVKVVSKDGKVRYKKRSEITPKDEAPSGTAVDKTDQTLLGIEKQINAVDKDGNMASHLFDKNSESIRQFNKLSNTHKYVWKAKIHEVPIEREDKEGMFNNIKETWLDVKDSVFGTPTEMIGGWEKVAKNEVEGPAEIKESTEEEIKAMKSGDTFVWEGKTYTKK